MAGTVLHRDPAGHLQSWHERCSCWSHHLSFPLLSSLLCTAELPSDNLKEVQQVGRASSCHGHLQQMRCLRITPADAVGAVPAHCIAPSTTLPSIQLQFSTRPSCLLFSSSSMLGTAAPPLVWRPGLRKLQFTPPLTPAICEVALDKLSFPGTYHQCPAWT